LTNYELHQQKDSEALKGTLEAGLEMIVSQLRKDSSVFPQPCANQATYIASLLLSALPLFRHCAMAGDDKRKRKKGGQRGQKS
jgi:hypothetical protein